MTETIKITTPNGENKQIIDELANKDKIIEEQINKLKQLEAKVVNQEQAKEKAINYWLAEYIKLRKELLKEREGKKEPVILFDELEKKDTKLTKIKGILTSNLRTRTISNTPFIRLDIANDKHTREECEAQKCQSCELPVIFRTKTKGTDLLSKPNLKKGDSVILTGEFANSSKSNRLSFTCYAYEILKDHE